MSENLRDCLKEFEFISKLSTKLRKQVLQELSKDEKYYKALKEISRNIINKNIRPSEGDKKKLNRFSEEIFEIGSTKVHGPRTKRRIVVQSGGWIGYLIPAVITAISGLINGI